ncbi:zinc finger domain-containing protein, LSD1 subclass [Chitinophaga costaii]|uniref:Zinc finger domain-containing protein, LSD1 subclass n=1 Tax=Chitinophaga costaii TaxID=1335309 RepID=A0A1C4CPU2_9BACT|nr:hypothetical protein [Chitinophaga costaii]PUZ27003.1 hypothetical protein DCM91_07120 [Chitinophaga costaii]SCC21148.1 zinc finger domain-containing protein, LSD1 subclass [Chitinophaga costaii]
MPFEEKTANTLQNTLKCASCGAALHYAPGTESLTCDYCGTVNKIDIAPVTIMVVDYEKYIATAITPQTGETANVVKCSSCGASTTLLPNVTSDTCPFCASPLVIAQATQMTIPKPHYVLPFAVKQQAAYDNFGHWLKKLWFAPSDLVKKSNNITSQQLKGIYIPYWSFDTNTYTAYQGERGEYYYTTETRTVTVNGESRTETYEQRHTRWYSVSGRVQHAFRDVLVSASPSLPQKLATQLEPWRLEDLVGFDERFLSGFRSEMYSIAAPQALQVAKDRMDPVIQGDIQDDIGGDEQRIDNYNTDYKDLGLKYILLPVWISAYRYNNKLYHVVVNACTGEVAGERPYSALKIALLVIGILAVVFAVYILANHH